MNLQTPPSADQFEVSIIGPGRGECIILHLGNNEWAIVDSCIAHGFSESVASQYLTSLENGALDRVRLIVATHWHDDHIRGLASLVKRVPTARLACSHALQSDEFIALVSSATAGIESSSGVDEFSSILRLMETAPTPEARSLATPRWASENKMLLKLDGVHRIFPVTITALSPSDRTVTMALREIGKLIPKVGDLQTQIPSHSPNHASIALWVEAGPLRVLLGADLERTNNVNEGWSGAIQCHQDRHDQESAVLFKVPHHGSVNADHPDVWTKMLANNPLAVVTPYNAGRHPLPRSSDLKRLNRRTSNLYCTAFGTKKLPIRAPIVEKTMRRNLKNRRVIESKPGQVRVRWHVNGKSQPTVELFHGAYRASITED